MKKENNNHKPNYEQLYNSTANFFNIPIISGNYQRNCDYCGYDLSGETRCPNCGQGVRTRNGRRFEK